MTDAVMIFVIHRFRSFVFDQVKNITIMKTFSAMEQV